MVQTNPRQRPKIGFALADESLLPPARPTRCAWPESSVHTPQQDQMKVIEFYGQHVLPAFQLEEARR